MFQLTLQGEHDAISVTENVFLGSGNGKYHKLTPPLSCGHLIPCHRDKEQACNLKKYCIFLELLIWAMNAV
jgi:hypothetical protein